MAATTQVRLLVDTSVYACLCCVIGARALHKAPTQAQQELPTSARLAQTVERLGLNFVVVERAPRWVTCLRNMNPANHQTKELSLARLQQFWVSRTNALSTKQQGR